MQTSAIHNFIVVSGQTARLRAAKTARASRTGLLRTLVHRWDMTGVVSLMVSSAAYGVYALSHLAPF